VAGSQGSCRLYNHFSSPFCDGDANAKRNDFSFSFPIRGKHIYVLPIQANWNRQMLNQTAMGK